ncbi:unnamed protein product [Rotaria sordida]|uniref:Homeobox domain-containing protein n=1 Tax=Rotaria sordida TaxID=392033 RepID=A0A813WIP2_9BILA|nr:unnamed protein product [Rotaria sordida]CAF0895173.1 unnamed protein product [Rotaria sordida]CAF0910414.1 unnamed protein product [Rotaria sordida]CAF3635196.1 unnamed protein product [Rotaria sordida]CAF3776335.1 unnamed protein product [Rotaria sordida]
MSTEDIIIKEEPIVDRTIHFLIPALSADEPSHILSLPETFAIQQSPLEIPLPSGKYILAPSPSELFHYYESVQPQMNSIISSSEGIIDHLTSENFIHIVENLSEYSIPCPVLQSHVDKSTSMISMDDFDETISNQPPITEYYFRPSPSYYDPICEYSSSTIDDPNLFIHNEQLTSYLNNSSNSSSNCDVNYQWTTLPVTIASSNNINWKKVRSNGNHNNKIKARNSRKRTKFSNGDLEILNLFFERNPMPSRSDISILSEKLAYPRYIIQVWFYNKRQSLKRANSSSSRLDRIAK